VRDFDQAYITVEIRPPGYGNVMAITLPIGLFETRQMFQHIDFPSDDAGLAAMFCTPDAERKLMERKRVIAEIAHIVAHEMADLLGAKDTKMGYPEESGC
jgi:hypothetical protein